MTTPINSIAGLKRFLQANIGTHYTVKNYKWTASMQRKLSKVQSNGFWGTILDQGHVHYGKESWMEFPKASDIVWTDKGFIVRENGMDFLEYTFDALKEA